MATPNEKEIDYQLKLMLGSNAFENNMAVNPDFANAIRTIRYLVTQINITGRWCDEEGKSHIQDVINNTKDLLLNP